MNAIECYRMIPISSLNRLRPQALAALTQRMEEEARGQCHGIDATVSVPHHQRIEEEAREEVLRRERAQAEGELGRFVCPPLLLAYVCSGHICVFRNTVRIW